uniref:Uncharacterized protein n=1 Tax=viral metagenome TaxID=1070528 RepID=A0A6M3LB85_9ZZZZ
MLEKEAIKARNKALALSQADVDATAPAKQAYQEATAQAWQAYQEATAQADKEEAST